MLTWIGFFLSIAALLLVSRKNLGVAMFAGAVVLGLFTMTPLEMREEFYKAIFDATTILSALTVVLIPIIGGTLKKSGQMDNLVDNVRVGKKAFLALSPALIGMLPMPGGALLSAPLVEKAGDGVPNAKKAGLNVWFRHVLYLVYPMTPALIITARIAERNIYEIIPYFAPLLLFSLILGYVFFLRDVPGKISYEETFSFKKLLPPLVIILIAPALDFALKDFIYPEELATFIGVTASLILAIIIGKISVGEFLRVTKKSKPWNFGLMMVGILVFLNVFVASGIPELIKGIEISAEVLCVTVGFLLGFGTGRIVTPAGIIVPIFLTKFGPISPVVLAITYFNIFLGYAVSPVHPCVTLSIEFFKTNFKEFFKIAALPIILSVAASLVLLLIVEI